MLVFCAPLVPFSTLSGLGEDEAQLPKTQGWGEGPMEWSRLGEGSLPATLARDGCVLPSARQACRGHLRRAVQ